MISDFHFLRPAWLLAIVPAAAVLWTAVRLARTGTAWRGLVDAHLLRALLVDGSGRARRWPLGLAAAGWLLATLAMAGPTWERAPQPTADAVAPTVVALDMSPSMQADDLKPSRLAHARFALQDLLAESAGGQVGLVLYSDEPYVASPLTDDPRVIEEMIPTLTPDLMPAPGSRADRAITLATDLLRQAGAHGGRIVLLSDGVDEQADATLAAARAAAAAGHGVSVLGIGTAEGAPVRDARGRMLRDADGRPLLSPLDRDGLEAVADAGDGRFILLGAGASNAASLGAAGVSGGTVHAGPGVQADVWRDAGIWLVLALVVLAPFGFRRGWLAVAVLALGPGSASAEASVWSDLWARPDQQGAAALEAGRAGEAAELFADPSWKAAAHYQSGEFDEAAERYRGLGDGESRYNLGNALARGGKLEDALAAYDEVLKSRPDHEDARFNRDLVQKLLDQQKQQEQQQQGGDSAEQQNGGGENEASNAAKNESGAGDQQAKANSEEQSGKGEPQQSGADEQQANAQEQKEQRAGSEQQAAAEEQQPAGNGEQPADAQRADATDAQEPRDDDAEPGDQQTGTGTGSAHTDSRPVSPSRGTSTGHAPVTEQQQAREQVLRRIPDDPGGLLRAKIMRRYAEQRYATGGGLAR
jgi:Ca-activated chloride channel family protein